jgi:RimJ/RimL family protein N-acetyltransferase
MLGQAKYIEMVSIVPMIESSELVLEALTIDHAEGVFAFASHDQVAKTVTWEAHQNLDESRHYIRSVKNRQSIKDGEVFLCWAVRKKSNGKIIGLVSFTELAPIRAQIGYVFHYDHWNSSEPINAILMVLEYIYQNFKRFERIQGRCFPANSTSRNLLQKVGMQFEGINQAMIMVQDQVMDLACYAMTRSQWKLRRETVNQDFESGCDHI